MSLGGFFCMLLRVQRVRVRQVGVMADLLVVAAQVKFGCLLPVASRLFLCCAGASWCVAPGTGIEKSGVLACAESVIEGLAPAA